MTESSAATGLTRLFTGISQLATNSGSGLRRGSAQGELTVISDAALAVRDGVITWLGQRSEWRAEAAHITDLDGRAVVPGLVDPHTHAVWAGDRLADFEGRARSESYESVLARGGGIRSTMRATAAADLDELVALALPRITKLLHSGATTIEIKSGYGFTPEAELRMLEAVRELQSVTPARLVPTLLIHVPPAAAAERPAYLQTVVQELIPEATRRKLADAVDVFVEREAFTIAETEEILQAARERNLNIKLHADQFHVIGGVELGIAHRALSIDHLEASTAAQFQALAQSDTVATVLPGVTLHLGLPAAPGRKLIDAGSAVATGTDLNPGSSPLYSTAQALALSVRLNGLTPAEALTAATSNAAAALGLDGPGRLEPGCPADFLVLNGPDWREIAYDLSGTAIAEVWLAGDRLTAAGKQM
jgi:imidazolonepropionase